MGADAAAAMTAAPTTSAAACSAGASAASPPSKTVGTVDTAVSPASESFRAFSSSPVPTFSSLWGSRDDSSPGLAAPLPAGPPNHPSTARTTTRTRAPSPLPCPCRYPHRCCVTHARRIPLSWTTSPSGSYRLGGRRLVGDFRTTSDRGVRRCGERFVRGDGGGRGVRHVRKICGGGCP